MPRGPLPKPDGERARRNAPVIPTTSLPVGGRSEPAPECPIELGEAGRAWWVWAWSTPQAAGWSDGDAYFVAHRAELEDDCRALDAVDFDVVDDMLGDPEAARQLAAVIRRLKALALGKVSLTKTMTDMDDRLGLTPKGMAALRWKIVAEEEPAKVRTLRPVPRDGKDDPRRMLSG